MSLILVIGLAKWLFMGIVTIIVFDNKKQIKQIKSKEWKEWKEVEDILEQMTP
ncbi:MAG: hypothetical protein VX279_00125 [Candidatus Neomarinimicrobiota bacterium]|nr:hypothetical protein [Candidatus Neomarinimicrobiota bacterium]